MNDAAKSLSANEDSDAESRFDPSIIRDIDWALLDILSYGIDPETMKAEICDHMECQIKQRLADHTLFPKRSHTS